jgi:chemotaxis family two-component system sensor histidine kinase/response regulator PixL
MTDWQIQEQAYAYFLAEAPELLQTIEREILTLPTEHTTPKVHSLMRSLHTLKGAAASVDLELIKKIAHSLEDIVRVFYNLEVEIEPDIQGWLLEGYSALHSCLDAQILGLEIDEDQILAQFERTLGKLQHKLGDLLEADVELPTAVELGFDIVASIFETNIPEQIANIQTALACQERDRIQTTLTLAAEMCTGLAESIELPGFLAISQAIATAVSHHPDKIEDIATLAIANLQQAQADVLAGDREQGGKILPELAILAQGEDKQAIGTDFTALPSILPPTDREAQLTAFCAFLTSDGFRTRQPLTVANQNLFVDVMRLCWDWFEQCTNTPGTHINLELLMRSANSADLDYINYWVGSLLSQLREPKDSPSLLAYRRSCVYQVVFAVAKYLASEAPQIKIEPEFLDALRSQLQTAVNLAKQYPPITDTERSWLDRVTLPYPWAKRSHPNLTSTLDAIADDELLDRIWGEPDLLIDPNLVPTAPIVELKNSNAASLSENNRSIQNEKLQFLLLDLHQQLNQQYQNLQHLDLDSNPNWLTEILTNAESFTIQSSIILKLLEELPEFTDRSGANSSHRPPEILFNPNDVDLDRSWGNLNN